MPLVLVLAFALGAMAGKKRLDNLWVIGESVENFRAEPNGTKLGTLLQGTEIEQIGEQDKWVRFRVEGWVWGPSLEGYEEEEDLAGGQRSAEPMSPLQDELPRLKKLVNDKYGVFYGVDLDEDLRRLRLRMRVGDIGEQVLDLRLQAVQRGVYDILAGIVDFDVLRVETNRPDGSGEVGVRIAEISVEDLVRFADDKAGWRANSRFSNDGGETWKETE